MFSTPNPYIYFFILFSPLVQLWLFAILSSHTIFFTATRSIKNIPHIPRPPSPTAVDVGGMFGKWLFFKVH